MSRLVRGAAVVLVMAALHHTSLVPAHASEPCPTTSVGVDTSLADGSGGTVHDSVGQSFLAQDTLVTSFTIWRVPGVLNDGVRPIFVLADAQGVPTATTVWEGPYTWMPDDSLVTPFTWAFDPPLVLPQAGHYAWFACAGLFDLLAVRDNQAYPDGNAWGTCRGDCGPETGCVYPVNGDFVFEVTFCSDRATPARRRTWGRLKSIYR